MVKIQNKKNIQKGTNMKSSKSHIGKSFNRHSRFHIASFFLCCALVVLTLLSVPNIANVFQLQSSPNYATANTEVIQTTYLKSPTLVQATSQNLYVFDSYSKKLSAYSISTKTALKTSEWNAEVIGMCYSGNNLFCLIAEDNENSIYEIDLQTLQKTKLQYAQKISTFTAVYNSELGVNELYLYTLKSDGSSNTIDITYHNPLTKTNQLQWQNSIASTIFNEATITSLCVVSGKLYYSILQDEQSSSPQASIHKLQKDELGGVYQSTPQNASITTQVTSLTVSGSTSVAVLANNNLVIGATAESYSEVTIPKYITMHSACVVNDGIYITDSINQKIYVYSIASDYTNLFLKNTTPSPIVVGAQNNQHKYLCLTSNASLYISPYATTSSVDVPSGTHLIVIAQNSPEYSDFYYCIYTNGTTNQYLYLPKTASYTNLNTKNVSVLAKVMSASNCKLYSLPSTITDSNNVVLEELPSQSNITQIVAQVVTNAKGEDYYVVTTPSGNTGYIRYTHITTAYSQVATKKLKCNGKTKRATSLYVLSGSSTSTYSDEEIAEFNVLALSGNTRVVLNEKINPSKKYTYITYQTEDGSTFNGYILTEDIKADALTSMQIIGIVLVLINIALLVVILVIKKRYTSKTNGNKHKLSKSTDENADPFTDQQKGDDYYSTHNSCGQFTPQENDEIAKNDDAPQKLLQPLNNEDNKI